MKKKNAYALKTPHVVFLPDLFLSFFFGWLSEMNAHFLTSWPWLWPMTFTYKLDLDILPTDFHAKIQVCTTVRSAAMARRTDRHTDRQTHRRCQNYYTHHARDVGCNNLTLTWALLPISWPLGDHIIIRIQTWWNCWRPNNITILVISFWWIFLARSIKSRRLKYSTVSATQLLFVWCSLSGDCQMPVRCPIRRLSTPTRHLSFKYHIYTRHIPGGTAEYVGCTPWGTPPTSWGILLWYILLLDGVQQSRSQRYCSTWMRLGVQVAAFIEWVKNQNQV